MTIYAKLRSWGMHPKDRLEETGEGPTSARWTMGRIPVVEEAPSSAPATPASGSQKRAPGKG